MSFAIVKLTSRPDGSFEELESERKWMPVPRCDSCAHWTPRPEDGYVDVKAGACGRNAVWSDCNDYTILTEDKFGCVEWKEKP